MSPWNKALRRPAPCQHLVELYDRDENLASSVGCYLLEGIKQAEGIIIIADAWHRELFRDYLEYSGVDTVEAERQDQLLFLDGMRTLDSFVRRGQPVWELFEPVIRTALRRVRAGGASGLRAYGEMVGILWNAGRFDAAIRLEQYWNKLLNKSSFSLFCGYQIDVMSKDFSGPQMDALLCTHTHLVPSTSKTLEAAIRKAMEEARIDLPPMQANRAGTILPGAESLILALRKHRPRQTDEILARARQIDQAVRSPLPDVVM